MVSARDWVGKFTPVQNSVVPSRELAAAGRCREPGSDFSVAIRRGVGDYRHTVTDIPRGCIAAVALSAVLAMPGVGHAQAQTDTGAAREWVGPRTVDGQPDLQGVWLSNIATPVERPASLVGREYLTESEVLLLRERAERIFANGRSAFAVPEAAYSAALGDVETFESPTSTSSSIGMVDLQFGRRTSLVVDPPDGRIPTVTDEARSRQAQVDAGWRFKTGPEDLSNIHRCLTTGVPRLGGNFGAGPYTYYQIFQSRDHVVVMMEAFHDARVIPLSSRPPLPDRIRLWNGSSRGHWDGDTLVVETGNFSGGSFFLGARDGLVLVERFTRTAADVLTYRMTFRDPTTWASPWTAEMPLQRRDETVYEFACHEGNHSMVGMLTTARVEDRVGRD